MNHTDILDLEKLFCVHDLPFKQTCTITDNNCNFKLNKVHICPQISYIKVQDDKTVVVRWSDNTVTHVRCEDGEKFDLYTAFCAALAKRVFGSTSTVKQLIDSHNVETINAKKEAERKKRYEELKERERINHERKIRRIAKRMREEEEARKYNESKI